MEDRLPKKNLKRKTLSPSDTEAFSDTEDSSEIEELNEENPQKKIKLTRVNTPDIIQNNWDELTNSQYITNHNATSVKSHARPLAVPKENFDVKEAKDMLVVSALSQEASRRFATNFHKKITNDDWSINNYDINSTDKATLESKVLRTQKNNHADFIQSVFENKRPSHVIAVIEGKSEPLPKSFVFEDTAKRKHTYKLQDTFIQGRNVNNAKDAKQNMHYYVREDMEGAVTISEARITSENINSKTKNKRPNITFPVGKINFETEDGSKYSMLVPHMPNDVVGTLDADQTTHDAFETYAEQQKTTTGEMVIGYIGDTNYTAPREDRTVPSVGGYMEDGAFISVTSSSRAEDPTFFMQGVPLTTNEDEASFAMQQPITLNLIDLNSKESNIATDHPSIQTGIFLTERIKGRALSLEEDVDENYLEEDKKAASLLAQSDDEILFQTPDLSDTQDLNPQSELLHSESSDLERSLARFSESIREELQKPHSFQRFQSAPTRSQIHPKVHHDLKLNGGSFELVDNNTQVKTENAKPMQTNPNDVALGSGIETDTEKEKTDNLTEGTNNSFRLN